MTRSQSAKILRWAGLLTGAAIITVEMLWLKTLSWIWNGRPNFFLYLLLLLLLVNIVVAWKWPRKGSLLFLIQAVVWPYFYQFTLSFLIMGSLFYLSNEEKTDFAKELKWIGLVCGIGIAMPFAAFIFFLQTRFDPLFLYPAFFIINIGVAWKSPFIGGLAFLGQALICLTITFAQALIDLSFQRISPFMVLLTIPALEMALVFYASFILGRKVTTP